MITPARRTLAASALATMVLTMLAAPSALGAGASTWQALSMALAAGGRVELEADVTGAGVSVSAEQTTTLDLAGHDLTLTGAPALRIVGAGHLRVEDSVGGGTLTAIGTGNNDAAIGSPANFRGDGLGAGRLTIDGADVVAGFDLEWGNPSGSAVGGGFSDDGMEVTVVAGSLSVAADFSSAAGIGGGDEADGGSLTVRGGSVVVELTSSSRGAAIGGGNLGDGGSLSVYGGRVEASNTGTALGSAVGGGYRGDGGVLSMHGGTLSAVIDGDGAGIGGGGDGGDGGDAHVNGGTLVVDRAGGRWAAGIGGSGAGNEGPGHGGSVWITGGSLDIEGGYSASTIGAGAASRVNPEPPDHGVTVLQALPDASLPSVAAGPHGSLLVYAGVAGDPHGRVVNTPTEDINGTHRTQIDLGHLVTFDVAGGGPAPEPTRVAPGSAVAEPQAPSRTGFTFAGWFHDGAPWDFTEPVSGDLVLTARWTEDPVTPVNLVDVSSDPDSPFYTQFHREIQWLADRGITKGWDVGGGRHEFRPKNEITRDAMAAFMYRYAGSPPVTLPAQSPFSDVTPTNTAFYREIIWMSQQGISTGWSVGGGKREFRPGEEITRDAMAAFMYRLAGEPASTPPTQSPFVDVRSSDPFYREITWLAGSGISTGWHIGGGRYEYRPYDEITREAMAAFLYRYDQL
ncbi:S-layer homology domain-containing protein [Demequina sp. NBRC 110053]|uniref:S-layer homology domain-containing protein n=1 Tax=Demequina sp. NBRC 110053 TaxID=1570342 RepID=UPI001184FE54|nr:S-layer homology domain-containing protein [Demequina sp. NBRC 110053]